MCGYVSGIGTQSAVTSSNVRHMSQIENNSSNGSSRRSKAASRSNSKRRSTLYIGGGFTPVLVCLSQTSRAMQPRTRHLGRKCMCFRTVPPPACSTAPRLVMQALPGSFRLSTVKTVRIFCLNRGTWFSCTCAGCTTMNSFYKSMFRIFLVIGSRT